MTFANFAVQYIPMHHELYSQLEADDFSAHTGLERMNRIEGTIQRLYARNDIREEKLEVRVLLTNLVGEKGIKQKQMT